jgi:hypothetical protein
LELTSAGDIGSITELQLNLNGAVYTAVPVTAGLSAAAAEAALVAAGLVLGTSTSSMTDDTAAGLVASSSPAAGTGVAAGSAVDLVVSLGDRHTRIPVKLASGQLNRMNMTSNGNHTIEYPDGSVGGGGLNFTSPAGESKYAYIVMNAGHTVAEILGFEDIIGGLLSGDTLWQIRDLVYCRPINYFAFWTGNIHGDVAELKDVVAGVNSGILFLASNSVALYGDITEWPALKSMDVSIYYSYAIYGHLKFQVNAPTTTVRFFGSTSFSAVDFSQTIINWNACNPNTFARTGNFNQVKRSQLTAAGEAAVVALIAKGCAFTFKAE